MTVNCEGLSTRLEEILKSDDKARLMNLLRDQPTDLKIINSLVEECVESGAQKCLIALIRGEVCNIHPTFNAGKLPHSGVTALAYVAHSCPDPEIINLILTKCGGACLANVDCTIGLKPILDSLRVLVEYTDSINDIAWTILKNGGLRQFTALLLIAREKVIAPFDTGFTIHEYIEAEIRSFPEGKLDNEQEEFKCIFRDALKLLALFEKTGDDLSSYCSSMQKFVPGEQVVIDVSTLLIKNHVIVDCLDVNLDDCDLGYNVLPLSFIQRLMSMNQIDQRKKFFPKEAIHPSSDDFYRYARPERSASMPIPKLACLQQRLYTTGACQARKMSKYSLHTGVSPFPRHLGYITLKFINRARFM